MRRVRQVSGIGCIVIAAAVIGCKSEGGTASNTEAPRPAARQLSATTLPAESPFAKLTYGMGTAEVSDLIGPPTDEDARVTGKVFNPFYYGTDTHRATWFYKGQGRLIFNSRGRLLEVKYDPNERGYR